MEDWMMGKTLRLLMARVLQSSLTSFQLLQDQITSKIKSKEFTEGRIEKNLRNLLL